MSLPGSICRSTLSPLWRKCNSGRLPARRESAPLVFARKLHDWEHFEPLSKTHAYIALGSNVGDRVGNIEWACRELDNDCLTVTRTSALYETAPMYHEDQDSFINGVCEVAIGPHGSPRELLRRVKVIEERMGRQKTIENGPRNIDLDILLCGQQMYEAEDLTVPHRNMLEREFVIRPLSDLIPYTSHPGLPGLAYERRLKMLETSATRIPMPWVTAVTPRIKALKSTSSARPTLLMGILNLTPDSFSDGGKHPTEPNALLPFCESMCAAGATIIDIGGYSTRPNASQVDEDVELARILPIIRLLRSKPEFDHIALSVDTFRAGVARETVAAGADLINDVSGGTLDSAMLPTVAELGCGIVLMHMRGDSSSMSAMTNYSKLGGVTMGVAMELVDRVQAAQKAGIRRWRIMLDPGIGFAKSGDQNLTLLRNLGALRSTHDLKGFPWLLGPSRKRFIGQVTGVSEPRDRLWGTAAAVAASVMGGADVVRVHDVKEMKQVSQLADAIVRSSEDSDMGSASV